MATPYAVTVATEVLVITRGKEFGFEFDIGPDETSPSEDLSDYVTAEFELGQGEGQPSKVYSMATGEVTIENNFFKVRLSAAQTAALVKGDFAWFASMGQTLGLSDEGVVRGGTKIKDAV